MLFGDFELELDDLVYQPAEDSFLLCDNLDVGEDDLVWELGTGSGIVGLHAARLCRYIVLSDVNLNAVALAERNFKNNGLSNFEVRAGDLFEPVENCKFDLILFNAPYLPTDNDDVLDDDLNYAFDGGLDGRKTIDLFIDGVKNHLNEYGKVQLVQSSLSDNTKTIEKFQKQGFTTEITASEHYFFEDIVVITAHL